MFCKKDLFKAFAIFTGKHLCQSSMSEVCNFIKKETMAHFFSGEFCKIFKKTFFYRTPLVAASVHKLTLNKISEDSSFYRKIDKKSVQYSIQP